jgi:hypothetical protein
MKRHVSQNVNQNVHETGFTVGKIDPLAQGHVRLFAERDRSNNQLPAGQREKSGRTLIGQRLGDFVSPDVPALHEVSRVDFKPGTRAGSLKEFADRIGLLAMATARRYDLATQAEVIEPIILASNRRQ